MSSYQYYLKPNFNQVTASISNVLKFSHFCLSVPLQAVSAIADIRKDIPIHLELASMTDKEYMSRIMQEVHVEHNHVERSLALCVFSPP